jgi:hypothetical protein
LLYSIIIPTKDRPRTASSLVQSILGWADGDTEIVVQDCGGDDSLGRRLAELGGDRVRYEHGGPASMSDNWNRAIPRARGEYVIIVGDDDGVCPMSLRAVRWAAKNDFDAITWWGRSRFFWPDYAEEKVAGLLIDQPVTGELTHLDLDAELRIAAAGWGERVGRLPHVYHGIARRRVLEAVRERTGRYFVGLTPDYYSMYAISGHLRSAVLIDYPFTIPGHCGASNTARVVKSSYRAVPAEHLQEFTRESGPLDWTELLPEARLQTAMLCESMVSGLRAANREDLIPTLDLAAVYADYLYEFPAEAPATIRRYLRASRALDRSLPRDLGDLAYKLGATIKQQTLRRVRERLAPVGDSPWLTPGASVFRASDIGEAVTKHEVDRAQVAARLPF